MILYKLSSMLRYSHLSWAFQIYLYNNNKYEVEAQETKKSNGQI